MEKISWTDRVKNEEVLHTVKDDRNILHTVKRKKTNLHRNCLLKRVIEGKEVAGKRGRSKRLLDDQKGTREYWIPICGELALEESMDLS
jgi:hypothetical protein